MYKLYYYDPNTVQEVGYNLILECISEDQCQERIQLDGAIHYRIEYNFSSLTSIIKEQ